jgi:hypothetical protein
VCMAHFAAQSPVLLHLHYFLLLCRTSQICHEILNGSVQCHALLVMSPPPVLPAASFRKKERQCAEKNKTDDREEGKAQQEEEEEENRDGNDDDQGSEQEDEEGGGRGVPADTAAHFVANGDPRYAALAKWFCMVRVARAVVLLGCGGRGGGSGINTSVAWGAARWCSEPLLFRMAFVVADALFGVIIVVMPR